MDPVKHIEFQNAIVDCRRRADFILDIYREVVAAFEKEQWDAKGPEMAMKNAEHAGLFTKLQIERMRESWQEIASQTKGADFGEFQIKLEQKMFNEAFNCALNSVSKLSLSAVVSQ